MKKKVIAMLPYLIAVILLFYVLPLAIRGTGSAMGVLLIGIPAGCFVTALIYGIRHSFNLIYVLLVFLLFVPTIDLFYNSSAAMYACVYGTVALIGNGIGAGIHHLSHKKRKSNCDLQ